MRTSRGIRVVLALAFAGLLGAPGAASGLTDFTWSNSYSGNAWSSGGNWVGGTAPSGSVGTLRFPALGACPCTYGSFNNISGLSANAISIDDGVGYALDGVAITLGGGGISAAPSAGDNGGGTSIRFPIRLGAPQTWSVQGGTKGQGLRVGGSVTGSADALGIRLSDAAVLVVRNDVEVGPVTLAGDGVVQLGARLNGLDGSPVSISEGLKLEPMYGSTRFEVGPLTSAGAALDLEHSPSEHVAQLGVDGGVSLDAASSVALGIVSSGTVAGSDFSQLSATGTVNLGGASLSLGSAGRRCPNLLFGDPIPLITTTGNLVGRFAGLPDGATVALKCGRGTPPSVRINYTPTAVTATFAGYGTGTWTPVAPPGGADGAFLATVNCPAVNECIALGGTMLGGRPVSAIWNGTQWTTGRAPRFAGPGMFLGNVGISCLSDTACLSVGGRHAVRWNGSRWSSVKIARSGLPQAGLNSISCSSTRRCTAVGGYFLNGYIQPVVAQWTGHAWHLRRAPTPSRFLTSLTSVSCPSANDCIAVGVYFTDAIGRHSQTLAEHWNGHRWSIQRPQNIRGAIQNYLFSVDCPSRSTCFAVGEAGGNKAVRERWRAHRWKLMKGPRGMWIAGGLNSISCPATTRCTAVGTTSPLNGIAAAEMWDGHSWTAQPVEPPAHELRSGLQAVSCAATDACMSVGYFATGVEQNPKDHPLVEEYSGAPGAGGV